MWPDCRSDLLGFVLGGPLYFIKEGLQQGGGQVLGAIDEPLVHDQACVLPTPNLQQYVC